MFWNKQRKILMCLAVVAVICAGTVIKEWSTNNFIGLDVQYGERCLPQLLFVGERTLLRNPVVGDLVWFRGTEAERHPGKILLKMVAAVPGDKVEVNAAGVFINGVHWGGLNVLRSLNKKANDFYAKYVVQKDEVVVLGSMPGSFDSRYFGPIKLKRIGGIGHAII